MNNNLITCVNELVETMAEMRDKKDKLRSQIFEEEEEKYRVQKEITNLTERLEKINGYF